MCFPVIFRLGNYRSRGGGGGGNGGLPHPPGTKQHSDCVFPSGLWEKTTVYEQLALRWRIAKQLSEFNPLSLSNNKSYRLRKSEVLPL